MNLYRLLTVAAGLCLWLLPAFSAQSDPPSNIIPQKHVLAIPVATPGRAGRRLECMVTVGPSIAISAVAFSPDGKLLAVQGYREVLIWDLGGAKLLKRLGSGQLGPSIGALAFLKDGQWLAVGEGTPYKSGAVRVFDIQTGQQCQVFEGPKEVVYCLAVSPDGKLLAAGGAEPVARVWSVEDQKRVAALEGHSAWVWRVAFSRDGKLLATASADKTSRVWEVGTWKRLTTLRQKESVRGAAFSPDGRYVALAVGGPTDRAVRIRQKQAAQQSGGRRRPPREVRTIRTGAAMPLDVVWTPKNRIVVPCSDNTVKVFDSNGRARATLTGHSDWVYAVAVTADEAKIASASADGTVKLWNAADGKLIATLVQLSPGADQWLIITAQGYWTASSLDAIQWKTENITTPPNELASLLQKPDSVREAIAGKKVSPPGVK